MKTIKIFLASSSELKSDREQFEIFIGRRNKLWAERGVFLKLVIWEDFLDAMSQTRLQDETNKAIRKCDLFVMLFFTKVGKYTAEEFEAAFGQFKATNKPFIFTYFKAAEISTGTANKRDLKSLLAFQKKLGKLGHFYTRYKNTEDLLLQFGSQLDKLAEKNFIEMNKPDTGKAQSKSDSTTIQKAKKIYNIDKIDKANFSEKQTRMKKKINSPDNKNIVIQSVSKNTITVKVNDDVHTVPYDITELQKLIQAQGQATFQAGEKIYNIGEISEAQFTQIIQQNFPESRTSRYLKIFLNVFVPVVAISFAILYYQYRQMQQPLVFSVALQNLTPNPDLPFEKGKITLKYGDKTETQEIEQEAVFKGIPANFRGEMVAVLFEAQGFVKTDTSFILSDNHLLLPIRRDSSLARIFGTVKDDAGNPVADVQISVQDLTARSDAAGRFTLLIPFDRQRKEQRIRAFRPDYKPWDFSSPIIANEEIAIILHKSTP